MMTPITIEMDMRKAKLAELVFTAEENPLVDSAKILALFSTCSAEVENYKYFPSGYILLFQKLDELATVNNEHKAFLNSFVNSEATVTVLMAIKSYLS